VSQALSQPTIRIDDQFDPRRRSDLYLPSRIRHTSNRYAHKIKNVECRENTQITTWQWPCAYSLYLLRYYCNRI